MAGTLGQDNPLRYRGYVYDQETGLYYLTSRYYNPEWCRFISADTQFDEGAGIIGNNLFAYSANNPIMYMDPTGEALITCIVVGAIIGAVVGASYAAYKGYIGEKRGWDLAWYALKGGVLGAALGAAVYGVHYAAMAIGAKLAAGSCGTLGVTVYSNWQKAEQAVRSTYNAVKHTFIIPGMSSRIVDGFNKAKYTIYEVKYGYASLSEAIKSKIARDVWLRANNAAVRVIEWHFYVSQATGKGGPSGPLLEALTQAGIKVVYH